MAIVCDICGLSPARPVSFQYQPSTKPPHEFVACDMCKTHEAEARDAVHLVLKEMKKHYDKPKEPEKPKDEKPEPVPAPEVPAPEAHAPEPVPEPAPEPAPIPIPETPEVPT